MSCVSRRACVILAAGLGERFAGAEKLVADLGGAPLGMHAAKMARTFGFEDLIAVCPISETARVNLFCKAGYAVITPEGDEPGAGWSLAAGARAALATGANSLCVLLADMPFVSPETLLRLHEESNGKEAAFCLHDGRRGPPAVFSRAGMVRLTDLSGDRGAAALYRGAGGNRVAELRVSADELFDIDSRQDLEEARRRLT